jgi:hypothetical protein
MTDFNIRWMGALIGLLVGLMFRSVTERFRADPTSLKQRYLDTLLFLFSATTPSFVTAWLGKQPPGMEDAPLQRIEFLSYYFVLFLGLGLGFFAALALPNSRSLLASRSGTARRILSLVGMVVVVAALYYGVRWSVLAALLVVLTVLVGLIPGFIVWLVAGRPRFDTFRTMMFHPSVYPIVAALILGFLLSSTPFAREMLNNRSFNLALNGALPAAVLVLGVMLAEGFVRSPSSRMRPSHIGQIEYHAGFYRQLNRRTDVTEERLTPRMIHLRIFATVVPNAHELLNADENALLAEAERRETVLLERAEALYRPEDLTGLLAAHRALNNHANRDEERLSEEEIALLVFADLVAEAEVLVNSLTRERLHGARQKRAALKPQPVTVT